MDWDMRPSGLRIPFSYASKHEWYVLRAQATVRFRGLWRHIRMFMEEEFPAILCKAPPWCLSIAALVSRWASIFSSEVAWEETTPALSSRHWMELLLALWRNVTSQRFHWHNHMYTLEATIFRECCALLWSQSNTGWMQATLGSLTICPSLNSVNLILSMYHQPELSLFIQLLMLLPGIFPVRMVKVSL